MCCCTIFRSQMNKVVNGIRKHQVILLKGDNIRDVLKEYVYPKFPHESFSTVNMNLTRVSSSLSSKRWDGKRPVIIFFRCEQWMKDISKLIRNRQPNQAVIIVTDGEYTSSTQLMKSLASVHVVIGKIPPTIFSMLKTGPNTDVEKRYRGAIECTDIHTVMNQIHYSNQDTEISCTMSDVDMLQFHVPDELLVNCLPLRKEVEYNISYRATENKMASNLNFVRTIQQIVALSTSSVMATHETMEYLRYAHQIKICPNISQCPRDDGDKNLVKNVNDKIRVLVTIDKHKKENTRTGQVSTESRKSHRTCWINVGKINIFGQDGIFKLRIIQGVFIFIPKTTERDSIIGWKTGHHTRLDHTLTVYNIQSYILTRL